MGSSRFFIGCKYGLPSKYIAKILEIIYSFSIIRKIATKCTANNLQHKTSVITTNDKQDDIRQQTSSVYIRENNL